MPKFYRAILILLFSIGIILSGAFFTRLARAAFPDTPPFQYLTGDDTIGVSASMQYAPAIARGNGYLLAAWSDLRSAPNGEGSEFETANDIYGIRLDPSGNPVGTLPFVITQAPGVQTNPQIAWNGTHWLVVFETYDLNGTGYYFEKHLAAIRVASDGTVIDPTPIALYNTLPNVGTWSVASDGTDWVVAFQGTSSSVNISALKITADGQPQQPATAFVPETYYMRFNLKLAYADGVYLLTWADYSDTLALRFDVDLNMLDASPFTLVPGTSISALSSNGSQFYAVWVETLPDYTVAVMGTRIDIAGVKLDGDGDNISNTNSPTPYTVTSVAWDDVNWRINWENNSMLRIAAVDTSGTVLEPGGVSISGPNTGISAGSGSGSLQLAWTSYTDGEDNVLSANISSSNLPGVNIALSSGASQQVRPDAAAGSAGYMVVYKSNTASSGRIMAYPLDINGIPMLAEPVQLAIGYGLNAPDAPAVAWNGSLYMVAWANSTGIVAQRIDQNGTLIDPSPIPVMVGFGRVDISAVGDTFLVVGMRFQGNPEYIGAYGVRVRGTDGMVLDPSPILAGMSYTRSVAVTTFGTRWLVVSHATYTHDDAVGGTQAAFVNADGTTSSIFSVYGPYSMGGNGLIEVAVASSGNNALVLQSNELSSGVETDLTGSLLDPSGSVIASFNLTPWSGNQYRPRVAWDGDGYTIVYNDQKNRFAPWTMDPLDARSDLFTMRILENGTVVDPAGVAFSLSPFSEAYPNVVSSNGVSILLGSILRNDPPYGAYRVGYQVWGADGNDWPTVVASSNVNSGDFPLDVNFSSSGSLDPDGTITGYAWDFGDGTSSLEPNPSHTYTTPGEYVVTLTATDNDGGQSTNTVPVEVTAPNLLPVAIATADPTSGPAPLDVVFSAAGSYDPDGWLGNFHWSFSDGSDYWGATAYNTFYTDGIYTAQLTVYDPRGATATTTIYIYVGQPNQSPVAVASATPLNGAAPLTVDFSSDGSYDPDGTIDSYSWVFGDGGSSTSPDPSHIYTAVGVYPVTLTVTDNLGASDTFDLEITVEEALLYSIYLPMLSK